MPYGLVHKSEEKLRAHFMHTGTPSATGLLTAHKEKFIDSLETFHDLHQYDSVAI